MSVELNYPFTIPGNYTYSNKIDISGGIASITLNQIDADFTEDFADDTDFTYDNTLAEFTSGLVRQKDQTPSNVISWATFNSNISLTGGGGSIIGTGTGSPVITGNKLDLTGGTIKYVDYDANSNMDSQQVGTIRLIVTPDYDDKPASSQYLFSVGKEAGFFNNLIQIYHNSGNGYLSYIFYDSTGSLQGSGIFGRWIASTGVSSEITLCFDFTTGATRMFVDGIQSGSTLSSIFTRDSDINFFRLGNNYTGTAQDYIYIEDFVYYNTVLFTANYTPGYILPEYKYLETSVILPEMEHTGDGTIKLFNSFSTVESGSPRYTLQIGRSGDYLYWNGSSWVVSDSTYIQANDVTTFNANVGSLPVDGENYGQFKIIFPDLTTLSSVDELTANLNIDVYYTDNPTILVNEEFRLEALEGFTEIATKTNSEIKYILKKNDTWYYWNGSAWNESDQTYTQANTATEIETNKATFTTIGVQSQLMIFLHSDNGENTPLLDNIQILYDFSGEEPEEIELCTVWGYHYDNDGNPDSESFSIYLSEEQSKYKTQTTIKREVLTITPDSQGYWEVELVENANMETGIQYVFDFGNGEIFTRTVPNEDYKNYYELTG